MCNESNCSVNNCTKRHPTICRYFKLYGKCKFNQRCAYRHIESKDHLEIEKLRNEVKALAERLKFLEEQLQSLKQKENELGISNPTPVLVQDNQRKCVLTIETNQVVSNDERIPQLDGGNTSLESISRPTPIKKASSISDLIESDCWVCDVDFDTTEDLKNNFNEGRMQYKELELLCKECFIFLSQKFSKEEIFNCLG